MEYKGVVGSERRITITRIYVLTYQLWEGSVVQVYLHNRKNYKDSSFLARIQREFRIQIPRIEHEDLELKPRSILEIRLEKIEKGEPRPASQLPSRIRKQTPERTFF